MNLQHTLHDHHRSNNCYRPLSIVKYLIIFLGILFLASAILSPPTSQANEFTPGEGGSGAACGSSVYHQFVGFPSCSAYAAAEARRAFDYWLQRQRQRCQVYINHNSWIYRWHNNHCQRRVRNNPWSNFHP